MTEQERRHFRPPHLHGALRWLLEHEASLVFAGREVILQFRDPSGTERVFKQELPEKNDWVIALLNVVAEACYFLHNQGLPEM